MHKRGGREVGRQRRKEGREEVCRLKEKVYRLKEKVGVAAETSERGMPFEREELMSERERGMMSEEGMAGRKA